MTETKPGLKKATWLSALSEEEIKASIPKELTTLLVARENSAVEGPIKKTRQGWWTKQKTKVQPGLLEALYICHDNESELARALGVTPQAIQQWLKQGYAPEKRCKQMYEMYGISPSDTRKPMFAPAPPDAPPSMSLFAEMVARTIIVKKERRKK